MKIDYGFSSINLKSEDSRDMLWIEDFLLKCAESKNKDAWKKVFINIVSDMSSEPCMDLDEWYKYRNDILVDEIEIGVE